MKLEVVKTPNNTLAGQNRAFVHPATYANLRQGSEMPVGVKLAQVEKHVYRVDSNAAVAEDQIALNDLQRRDVDAALHQIVEVIPFIPVSNMYIHEIVFVVEVWKNVVLDVGIIMKLMLPIYLNFSDTFFHVGQQIVIKADEGLIRGRVHGITVHANGGSVASQRGLFYAASKFTFVSGSTDVVVSDGNTPQHVIRPDWNFDSMGIGGLENEFAEIFRRAFASRVFPPEQMKKMGMKHVKGLLLHGPPGTGKTLMAREIGKMLNGREPKVVNGPEILSKYVGQSEENVRALFADAEAEQKKKGEHSSLHIIIFDELDAICAQRGSRGSSTGVGDTVVNQLLSQMDGVNALNNVLVIGMTNRYDMIDDAFLRPGRFEVQMQIGLPDERGRLQILNIHTAKMRAAGIAEGIDLESIAERTKNFTGAEIEGLVRSAASFALQRHVPADKPTQPTDADKMRVTQADFEAALRECKPAHGTNVNLLAERIPNGVIDFSEGVIDAKKDAMQLVAQIRNSQRTSLVSVLIHGVAGSGKTAFSSWVALESGFPFAKVIEPSQMIGLPETVKCALIQRCFESAYKSPLSVIVIDDMERLFDYVPAGMRFSNAVFQTLTILCRKAPPPGHRLLVISTTSHPEALKEMGAMDAFDTTITLPVVRNPSAYCMLMREWGIVSANDTSVYAGTMLEMPVKRVLMAALRVQQAIGTDNSDMFWNYVGLELTANK